MAYSKTGRILNDMAEHALGGPEKAMRPKTLEWVNSRKKRIAEQSKKPNKTK